VVKPKQCFIVGIYIFNCPVDIIVCSLLTSSLFLIIFRILEGRGRQWRSCLRHCVTSRKVAD